MISVFYGTRPEYIKLYKLYSSIKNEGMDVELIQVCQHTDLLKDCLFDRVVEISENKNNRLNSVLVNCLGDDVFHENTTHVIVQGDTATTFGICLNAFNRKISVIHIEAGLRTWDKENPFPEESYRKAVSSMSDVHFCVTEMNANSLKNEGIVKCVYVVGNTVLDNLDKTNIQYGKVVPITLHRRENRDRIEKFLSVINDQAKNLPDLSFCYIRHPAIRLTNHFQNIQVLEPQPYEKMIDMLKSSRFVITDSGGIQEEGSFFQKKIIVCRETTERPEGLNVFAYKYNNLENLAYLINKFSVDFVVNAPCPYGDGKAIEKIIKHLKEMYGQKLYSGV